MSRGRSRQRWTWGCVIVDIHYMTTGTEPLVRAFLISVLPPLSISVPSRNYVADGASRSLYSMSFPAFSHVHHANRDNLLVHFSSILDSGSGVLAQRILASSIAAIQNGHAILSSSRCFLSTAWHIQPALVDRFNAPRSR
jgi:hypothetical protein